MSTELSIKKNLKPNSDVNFIVSLTFGDEDDTVFSPVLNFKVPRAIRSMNALKTEDFYFVDGGEASLIESVTDSRSYAFDAFATTESRGTSEVIVQLQTQEDSSDIIPNESRIKVLAPEQSPLSIINNSEEDPYLVTNKTRLVSAPPDSSTLVSLSVPDTKFSSLPSQPENNLIATYGAHSTQVTSTTSKRRRITISVGERLASGLIKENNVHDILLISFKQWKGALNDKVKRYYFKDGDLSDSLSSRIQVENTAPPYSFATKYFNENGQQRRIFTRSFSTEQGKYFAFYCTPVRYIKNKDNVWVPMPVKDGKDGWLQKNKNDKVVWGRAEYVW